MTDADEEIWPPHPTLRTSPDGPPPGTCPRCGYTDVPPRAALCPHCGQELRPRSAVGAVLTFGCLGLLVTALGGFLTCAQAIGNGNDPTATNSYVYLFWAGVAVVFGTVVWAVVLAVRKHQRARK